MLHEVYDEMPGMMSWALFSNDKRHRYSLGRRWAAGLPTLVWVMLNPSTADARQDDHTIRRCIAYARQWGYGGIDVVNLFSLRETNPLRMLQSARAGQSKTNRRVRLDACRNRDVIVAWGAHMEHLREYEAQSLADIQIIAKTVWHLGLTADGHPRHPARLRNDVERVPA